MASVCKGLGIEATELSRSNHVAKTWSRKVWMWPNQLSTILIFQPVLANHHCRAHYQWVQLSSIWAFATVLLQRMRSSVMKRVNARVVLLAGMTKPNLRFDIHYSQKTFVPIRFWVPSIARGLTTLLFDGDERTAQQVTSSLLYKCAICSAQLDAIWRNIMNYQLGKNLVQDHLANDLTASPCQSTVLSELSRTATNHCKSCATIHLAGR